MVTFPPIYTIAFVVGGVLLSLIFLGIINPIWVIAIVFICAPFIDILRAIYFSDIPFMGVYQELFLLYCSSFKIIATEKKNKILEFKLIDFLIILYIIWNLFQIMQSPPF